MYRQGDVLIVKDSVPRGAQTLQTRVVVYGETTGHAHRIEGGGELMESRGVMYLAARDGVRLIHEEHDTMEHVSSVRSDCRQDAHRRISEGV